MLGVIDKALRLINTALKLGVMNKALRLITTALKLGLIQRSMLRLINTALLIYSLWNSYAVA